MKAKNEVHVLWAGRPLCDFTTALPIDWPKGNSLVSIAEIASESDPRVTCDGCKDILPAALEKIKDRP